jgi:TonB family protein
MRCGLMTLMSCLCVTIALAAGAPEAVAERYRAQVMQVIEQAVLPEWGKHMDKVDAGTVTFRFRVYADGRIADLKIISSTGNRFLEEMSFRCMQTVKLPPVPAELLRDQPDQWLEMETQMKPEVNP